MEFLALFILASLGATVAHRFKFPASYLLGAFMVSGFISVVYQPVSYPLEVKFIARVLSGVLIGLKIRQEDMKMLKTVWKPLIFLSIGMIFYSTVLALFLAHFSSLSLTTALFGCVPGGMADIALMAEEYGADIPQVALVQLLRLITIIFFYPLIATAVAKKQKATASTPVTAAKQVNNITPLFPSGTPYTRKKTPPKKGRAHTNAHIPPPNVITQEEPLTLHFPNLKKNVVKKPSFWEKCKKKLALPPVSERELSQGVRTFVFAGIGALVFDRLGVPAGELLGSMAVTFVGNIKFSHGYFYPPLRPLVQITVGIIIGSTLTPDALAQMLEMLPLTLFTVCGMLGFGLLMGFFLHRFFRVDAVTAILSVAPGGVQEMVLLSDSLGGNVSYVTTLQVFRLIIVFSVFPLWISFLSSFLLPT